MRSREFDRHPLLGPLAAFNRLFCHAYHNIHIVEPCRMPASGPVLLVANHTCSADPSFIQACCPRPIVWMMAAEFLALRGLGWLFEMAEVIPVKRGQRDSSSLKGALRALESGRVVGIFPEGRIERSPALLPFASGAMHLARRAGAPIQPVALDGSQRNSSLAGGYLLPRDVWISFGQVIPPWAWGEAGDRASRRSVDPLEGVIGELLKKTMAARRDS